MRRRLESPKPEASPSGVQIIWAKERLVLSRGDYHWHQSPRYGPEGRQGALVGRPQADDALADPQPRPGRRSPRHAEAGRVHAPAILNNSSPGQAVYEPFMGSGTTLIAAETTGRVCLGIE